MNPTTESLTICIQLDTEHAIVVYANCDAKNKHGDFTFHSKEQAIAALSRMITDIAEITTD